MLPEAVKVAMAKLNDKAGNLGLKPIEVQWTSAFRIMELSGTLEDWKINGVLNTGANADPDELERLNLRGQKLVLAEGGINSWDMPPSAIAVIGAYAEYLETIDRARNTNP